jgi:anaerobic selenocysteine-containing dehydrogenase
MPVMPNRPALARSSNPSLTPGGSVDIHPHDALRLGILDGDNIAISSDRCKIETKAHLTETTPPGLAFMAFHWHEGPVNILTNSALDPQAKIPEFKISAVKAILEFWIVLPGIIPFSLN